MAVNSLQQNIHRQSAEAEIECRDNSVSLHVVGDVRKGKQDKCGI